MGGICQLARVQSHCVCGASFNANHAMICHHGSLIIVFICHMNWEIWLQAGSMRCAMSDVAVEPPSQPLTGKALVPISADCRDDAWADIHAREFWGRSWQGAGFNSRMFHPNVPIGITRLR